MGTAMGRCWSISAVIVKGKMRNWNGVGTLCANNPSVDTSDPATGIQQWLLGSGPSANHGSTFPFVVFFNLLTESLRFVFAFCRFSLEKKKGAGNRRADAASVVPSHVM